MRGNEKEPNNQRQDIIFRQEQLVQHQLCPILCAWFNLEVANFFFLFLCLGKFYLKWLVIINDSNEHLKTEKRDDTGVACW